MKTQCQLTTISPIIRNLEASDYEAVIENGESPTAIILALTVLISVLLGAITSLVKAIGNDCSSN